MEEILVWLGKCTGERMFHVKVLSVSVTVKTAQVHVSTAAYQGDSCLNSIFHIYNNIILVSKLITCI